MLEDGDSGLQRLVASQFAAIQKDIWGRAAGPTPNPPALPIASAVHWALEIEGDLGPIWGA